jgi:hypothetical protein
MNAQQQWNFLKAMDAAMAKEGLKPGSIGIVDMALGKFTNNLVKDTEVNHTIKPYTRIVEITPSDARTILEGNTHNRPLSRSAIMRYANDMKNNSWKMNGETIKISLDGRVIDGQHRLCAVVHSGVTIISMVTYDLDFDVFDTVDSGAKRTASDVFSVQGEKNTAVLAGAARIFTRYLNGDIEKPDNKLTTSDIEKTLRKYPEIRESVTFTVMNKTKIISPSIAAACHFIFSQINKEEADMFMFKFMTGAGINVNDQTFPLRSRMIDNSASKSKLPQKYIIALIFKSWNAFREGRIIKTLRYKTDGDAPEQYPVPK